MSSHELSLLDFARPLAEVARELPTWARGEPDEAALQTLTASARELHARSYTLWAWRGYTDDGEPAWVLPVSARATASFSPKGPMRALLRSLEAAAFLAGDPSRLRLESWRGFTCVRGPNLDDELGEYALADAHPPPSRAQLAALPETVVLGGPPIALLALSSRGGGGLADLARTLSVHPLEVALTLIAHNQPAVEDHYPPELVSSLREWGCSGDPAPPPPPSYEIADDPCPRRRHARKVLQRLLRMKKVGVGYHTEFDHLYRGAPPDERRQALEVGEALLRAGLLGEKPSVGQRHVYLRREALPEIHALIDRGETDSPVLNAIWTCPAPGAKPTSARQLRGPGPAPRP